MKKVIGDVFVKIVFTKSGPDYFCPNFFDNEVLLKNVYFDTCSLNDIFFEKTINEIFYMLQFCLLYKTSLDGILLPNPINRVRE